MTLRKPLLCIYNKVYLPNGEAISHLHSACPIHTDDYDAIALIFQTMKAKNDVFEIYKDSNPWRQFILETEFANKMVVESRSEYDLNKFMSHKHNLKELPNPGHGNHARHSMVSLLNPSPLRRVIQADTETVKQMQPPIRTRERTTISGQTTVAQLADELGMTASKARNLLRKANFAKPATGWTFAHDSPDLDRVRVILQSA